MRWESPLGCLDIGGNRVEALPEVGCLPEWKFCFISAKFRIIFLSFNFKLSRIITCEDGVKLCEEHNDQETKGDTLGVIADIYTDLGEIELAAKYYDEYIQMLYSLENAEAA